MGVGWWVVSSNYSIISGPDPLNSRFEFELERSRMLRKVLWVVGGGGWYVAFIGLA